MGWGRCCVGERGRWFVHSGFLGGLHVCMRALWCSCTVCVIPIDTTRKVYIPLGPLTPLRNFLVLVFLSSIKKRRVSEEQCI